MLDEIERLLLETKGVGDGIAHDLRTPLTRLRARLERALESAGAQSKSTATLAAGIEDIDQLLGTISALLRIAEDKRIQVRTDLQSAPAVLADGDLLFEAVARWPRGPGRGLQSAHAQGRQAAAGAGLPGGARGRSSPADAVQEGQLQTAVLRHDTIASHMCCSTPSRLTN